MSISNELKSTQAVAVTEPVEFIDNLHISRFIFDSGADNLSRHFSGLHATDRVRDELVSSLALNGYRQADGMIIVKKIETQEKRLELEMGLKSFLRSFEGKEVINFTLPDFLDTKDKPIVVSIKSIDIINNIKELYYVNGQFVPDYYVVSGNRRTSCIALIYSIQNAIPNCIVTTDLDVVISNKNVKELQEQSLYDNIVYGKGRVALSQGDLLNSVKFIFDRNPDRKNAIEPFLSSKATAQKVYEIFYLDKQFPDLNILFGITHKEKAFYDNYKSYSKDTLRQLSDKVKVAARNTNQKTRNELLSLIKTEVLAYFTNPSPTKGQRMSNAKINELAGHVCTLVRVVAQCIQKNSESLLEYYAPYFEQINKLLEDVVIPDESDNQDPEPEPIQDPEPTQKKERKKKEK